MLKKKKKKKFNSGTLNKLEAPVFVQRYSKNVEIFEKTIFVIKFIDL